MKKANVVNNKSAYKRAIESKYYPIVKSLLDRYGIRVKKWDEYCDTTTYWADFDQHAIQIPIPDCDWSLYICLHEIGHIVKGDRKHSYLQEYHAEKFALNLAEKYKLRRYKSMVKNSKHYVLLYIIQDIIFNDLDPNAVRKEVRAWLGVTPKNLKRMALLHCTKILKAEIANHYVGHSDDESKITKEQKNKVKQRKQEIYEIEPNN